MLCHIIGHDSGSLPPALPSERPATISQALENIGAGEGNRTLVISLEGCCSTIELHPHWPHTLRALAGFGQECCDRFSRETRAGWCNSIALRKSLKVRSFRLRHSPALCLFRRARKSAVGQRSSSGRDAPNSGGCTRRSSKHLPESEVRGRTAPSLFGLRRGSPRSRPKSGPACRAVRSRSERRLVGEVGLEPTKAKPADLQSAPFAARDTPPIAPRT